MQVAQDADIAWQRGGVAVARRTVRAGGIGAGPARAAAAAFLSLGDHVYAGLDTPWQPGLRSAARGAAAGRRGLLPGDAGVTSLTPALSAGDAADRLRGQARRAS